MSVFISYSHDSDEHMKNVLDIANRLRSDYVDCELDQYIENPPEGWPKWMDTQIKKAMYVIVVCTKPYNYKFSANDQESIGKGIKWESRISYQHIYDLGSNNYKFIPVVFSKSDIDYVLTPLKGNTVYLIPNEYEKLLRRLSGKPSVEKPNLGFSSKKNLFLTKDQDSNVATEIDMIDIELVIKEDFANFSHEKGKALLNAIKVFLDADYDIKIKKKREGSTLLTLGLQPEDAEKLLWAAKSGYFDNLNVVDANMVEVEAGMPTKLSEFNVKTVEKEINEFFKKHIEQKPPRNETERLLCSLWSQILKTEVSSILSDFYKVGGNSVLAIKLVSLIRNRFGIEMPLRTFFERTILLEQAEWLDKQPPSAKLPPAEPFVNGVPSVLSFAQQRLLFLIQLKGQNAAYNMPMAFYLQGHLNEKALQNALSILIKRHDSLRLCFPIVNGVTKAQFKNVYNPLTVIDLSGLPKQKQQQQVTELLTNHAHALFDLNTGPLLSVQLIKLGCKDQILLLNIHQIISDDWSTRVLIRECSQLYNIYEQNQTPETPKLSAKYTDYVVCQRDLLQGAVVRNQITYWKGKLAGALELLELHSDYPRPPVTSYQGKHLQSVLSTEITQGLNSLSKSRNVTSFMTLLTTFNVLLYRYSGQTDMLVGSPVANRTLCQTKDLVGFFSNTLILRTQIKKNQTFAKLLTQVKNTVLEAYNNQEIPFEYLIEQVKPFWRLKHAPLFQVMFILLDTPRETLKFNRMKVSFLEAENIMTKSDLTLKASEHEGVFVCDWEYNSELFRDETINQMVKYFQVLLEWILNNPEHSLSKLPLLEQTESQQLKDF